MIEVPAALATKGAAAEIAGRVSDESQIIEVTVNGRPVAVEPDGGAEVSQRASQEPERPL